MRYLPPIIHIAAGGLSIFLPVMFGSITLGDALWGWIAAKLVRGCSVRRGCGRAARDSVLLALELRSEEIDVLVPPIGAQPVA
jgi:hypothetical protein